MNKEENNSMAENLLRGVYKKNWSENEQKHSGIRLPSRIKFDLEDKKCTIVLDAELVKNENMQENENAFEGWAVALYYALSNSTEYTDNKAEIILDIDGTVQNFSVGKGHWGRFLYRALRFEQQYKNWFTLSERLKSVTEDFEKFLQESRLVNNIAVGEAGEKLVRNKENVIEAKLAENNALQDIMRETYDIGSNKVFRQLPVGLYKVEGKEGSAFLAGGKSALSGVKVEKENEVFTGGKSAIDLWTWKGNIFEVIELKTLNPMMGIITEIFFYSNYMYDLLASDGLFSLNKPNGKGDDRGYTENIYKNEKLKSQDIQVKGIMLADKYHPLIEQPSFMDILNENGTDGKIQYEKAKYESEFLIRGIK